MKTMNPLLWVDRFCKPDLIIPSGIVFMIVSLLLIPTSKEALAQPVVPDPGRPLRIMQEVPWAVNSHGWGQSMQPVQAFWDQTTGSYFINLIALLDVLGFQTEIDGQTIRSTGGAGVYEIDFENRRATFSVDGIVQSESELSEDGALRHGPDFLLTLPSVKNVLPPDALEYDETTLTVTLSRWVFASSSSPFRIRSIQPLQQGAPLLYGRDRKLLGGMQLGYRVSRSQRLENEVLYHGSGQIRASMLGGQIRANGTLLSDESGGEVVTNLRSASYLLDFPNFPVIRRIEAGRDNMYLWTTRKQFDGGRLSNLPLSTRNMQHEAEIKGVTEPNSLVSASVDGVVVDRTQADGSGRYVLVVPAYYGTSRAQLEISPLGGGPPAVETRHLFISEDLTPPGVFYWDLQGGRDPIDHSVLAHGQMRYGLSKNLSATGGVMVADSLYTGVLGITTNLGGFLNANIEVSYPETAGRLRLSLVRRNLRIRGEAEWAERLGFAYYRSRYQGQIGTGFRGGSIFLNGGMVETFAGTRSLNLSASGMVQLPGRINLLLTGGRQSTEFSLTDFEHVSNHYRGTLTRYWLLGRVSGRIGLQGDGGRYESIDFAGMTAYASYRGISLGTRFGYDFPASALSASLNLRLDAPWMSFTGYSSLDPINPVHRQSLYGSIELDRRIRFSRQSQTFSSVIFRPFVDLDQDGRWDAGEPPYPGLAVDVAKARVKYAEDGSIEADFLFPSSQYQVSIDPSSLKEPELVLSTGTNFSFLSDPGEAKYIDIPIYRNTVIEGTIQDLPLSSPTLAVIVFYQGQEEVSRAAVSQQGTFTSLLQPGTYRLQVIDLLGLENLGAFTQNIIVQSGDIQYLQIQPVN